MCITHKAVFLLPLGSGMGEGRADAAPYYPIQILSEEYSESELSLPIHSTQNA